MVEEKMLRKRVDHGSNRRWKSWKSLMADYLENSTVAGCNNYVASNRYTIERLIWFTVHVAAVLSMVFVIFAMTVEFWKNPTYTHMESDGYPIQDVNFPGIAICSPNKISYRAALALAEDILDSSDKSNLTVEELMDMLKYMGHLYTFNSHETEKPILKSLHTILEKVYKEYNVNDIMRALSPTCQSMLRYCAWEGKEEDCEDIFYLRKTMDGFCCTFNYARKSDDFGSKDTGGFRSGKVERSRVSGPRYGLEVLLDPEIHDHYYKLMPILGFKVLIYPSLDYPDASSGGLREVIISPRSEVFITLDAITFYTNPDVYGYNVGDRGCLFSTEYSLIFEGYYSHSDCIVYCRIADIIKLCKCVPFFYPIRTIVVKWTWVLPGYENERASYFVDNSIDNSTDPLSCDECFPACEDILYKFRINQVPISNRRINIGRNSYTIDDHSVLHISFGTWGTVRLKQEVLYYWYELMSNYGGICGLFLGISLISVIEFLYFFTIRLYKPKREVESRLGVVKPRPRVTMVKPRPRLQPLYWKEMIQPKANY